MKKFLSIILAVLMLASMAVSASAIKVMKGDGSLVDVGPALSTGNGQFDVDDYFQIFNPPYGGSFVYKGELIHTWWYDSCLDCKGLSFQYVKNGNAYYDCLEKDCGKSGTIYVKDETPDEDDKEDDKVETPSVVTCPVCKGQRNVFIETVTSPLGFVSDHYFCIDCNDDFYTQFRNNCEDEEENIGSAVICPVCLRKAYFEEYCIESYKLFARYVCRNGHSTYKKVNGAIDFEKYSVYVHCSEGGSYEIVGGSGAYYGEKKVIKFTPYLGYKLAGVIVDGELIPTNNNTVEVTVKNNTVVRAYFERISWLRSYTVTAKSSGHGTINAVKNENVVAAGKVNANYFDTVTYYFTPASRNYYVSSVKINGQEIGSVASYTVSKFRCDVDIEVTFKWRNPFCDTIKSYDKAIEFVTEAGIMSKDAVSGKFVYFNGAKKGTVKGFVDALVEMADVADILDSTADRLVWAIDHELIDAKADLDQICDVQTACALVRNYLELLEDINDVDFDALDEEDSVKETAIKIKMVTEKVYDKNRDLTRYDFAAILKLIAGLKYDD